MSSWFARSIPKEQEQMDNNNNNNNSPHEGIKQDLTEITQTLTRGFASLLSSNHPSDPAPPPPPPPISGIREISGKFRTGISKLSDVSAITKFAADLLHIDSQDDDSSDGDDDDDDDVVGVTDEVFDFVKDVSMHPKTWLDFPLPPDEDFDLSDVQQEHALAVERLAPTLMSLRIKLCPSHMSESSFWKIYFVLLHPILERHAAEILSTPNILQARASLTHELKNRSDAQSGREVPRNNSYSENISDAKSESTPLGVSAIDTVKHPFHSDEIQIVDKSVIQEEPREGKDEVEVEAEADDWLNEETSEIVTGSRRINIENDEDVSFSELEDDDDDDDDANIPIHYKKAA